MRIPCLLLLASATAAWLLPATNRGTAGADQRAARDPGDGGKADDPVRGILLSGPQPARDIFEIRQRLEAHGGKLRAHLVVNGGHDNPTRTDRHRIKFMCFATYANTQPDRTVAEDELFLGFFLGVEAGTVVVLPGFVELIAWDRTRQAYNFWELLGTTWHYRGDSNDVLANVARIHVADPKPDFTFERKSPTDQQPVLRCSGCHTLGGPIMKELAPPHNDWWTRERKLNLGPYRLQAGNEPTNPAHVAARLFDEAKEAQGADNLGSQVKNGTDRLLAARGRQAGGGQNVKQLLRPLFTTMETNLVSDQVPFKERQGKNEAVEVPQAFFVDARLAGTGQPIPVAAKRYQEALDEVGARFAPGETSGLTETHHAFLVPARSYIDDQAIGVLIGKGLLDEELVADVLAIDFTTPIFSPARAALMRYVPEKARDADDLRRQLAAALEKAPPNDRAARDLLANLTDARRTAAAHREQALAYLAACRTAAETRAAMVDWLRVAAQRRQEIAAAETARHPDGMILEPGFRVIFPVLKQPPRTGELRLDPATGRALRREP
jgi:hypothetical protein